MKTKPVRRRAAKAVMAWAAVSSHTHEICEVRFYKENLHSNMRHIRVRIVPITTHRSKGRK